MKVLTQKELNTVDSAMKMAKNFIVSNTIKEKLYPVDIIVNWKQGMFRREATEFKRWELI